MEGVVMTIHTSFWTQKRTFALFVIPGLSLYIVFNICPIIMGFFYSMTDWNGYGKRYHFLGFQNYAEIFEDDRFRSALLFNIKYSLFLVFFTVVLGMILALLLNGSFHGVGFFRSIYFFPAVLSMLTVGLIFNQIYYRALPPFGKMISSSLLSQSLLSRKNTAIIGVLFVHVWQGVALPTVLFLSGLQSVPKELYEAADMDGITPFRKFFSITLPFMIPVLSVVLVLSLKSGIMVFDYIMSMTNGGPGGATESIALLIYRHGFTEDRFSYSIAEAILAGIIIGSISAIQITASNKRKVEV
jgi:raffinose/stachyose/melibiose transport system permease protein